MSNDTTNLSISRLLLGLAGCLFVAVLVLSVGTLIIWGTSTETYLSLERALERFIGS